MPTIVPRAFLQLALLLLALFVCKPLARAEAIKIATFDVDATPPVGSAMAYDKVKRLDELTLRARGIVILGQEEPIVLCAVDWIGIGNEGHDAFCQALAAAANTSVHRVAVHALHQHDAPGCDFTGERIMKKLGVADLGRCEGTFHREVVARLTTAVKTALPLAQPATHAGWGEAKAVEVASNRRIVGPEGRLRPMRGSATKDASLRAEPEGLIDPVVSQLSFWNGDKPLAVLSYYACHPQSYYRTGVPSCDFPGIARFMRGQSVPEALHVHFNGAGGNVAAGKYNDGSKENRLTLATRLAEAMTKAYAATEKFPLTTGDVRWSYEPVRLPAGKHLIKEDLEKTLLSTSVRMGYIGQIDQLSFLDRDQAKHQIEIGCLSVGPARVLHMPGELFVEYQLNAKALRPDLKVAMAAYGDYGPGYIGTRAAYAQGGYEMEPRSTNVGPESEEILMGAVKKLLAR
ncbi:hypothetical protein [Verrucomicrobium sp. BvORR106]|uniref:hypothetical protein n=1 Tax=Verrucomicrobium sp. BvORR106 TaxID=1403819 RepID=UPI00068A061C|nr:hypothetical protein [Verrucomicrobium sp. BvORR106]